MSRLVLLLLPALLPACRETRCEELRPAPMAGEYRGGGSLGDERLLRVGLKATDDRVLVTWTMKDGSRIRATYSVKKKLKKP